MTEQHPPGDRRAGRWSRLGPVAALVLLVLVTALVWLFSGESITEESTPGQAATGQSATTQATAGQSTAEKSTARRSSTPAPAVPARVSATLALIDSGDWPAAANAPGTQGGRNFGNREGLLPSRGANGQRLRFQEWDVNPKQPGRGRDAERIITADDGSAWYTLDHYRTFIQIRGPSR